MIDIELLPLSVVILLTVTFLFIALYFNFIYREHVSEELILESMNTKGDEGHSMNTLIDFVDSDNGTIYQKKVQYNMISYDYDFIYITGCENISSCLDRNVLIELLGDEIYTVNLPQSMTLDNNEINIWNYSTETKNIRSKTKFIIDGVEKSLIFTLKPGMVVRFKNSSNTWTIVSINKFSENREMLTKYFNEKIDLLVKSHLVKLNVDLKSVYYDILNKSIFKHDTKTKENLDDLLTEFEVELNLSKSRMISLYNRYNDILKKELIFKAIYAFLNIESGENKISKMKDELLKIIQMKLDENKDKMNSFLDDNINRLNRFNEYFIGTCYEKYGIDRNSM